MAEPDFRIHQYATLPRLRAELTDDNDAPLPLDGASITFIMGPWKGGAVQATGSGAVVQEDAEATVVEYAWRGSGDTRTYGYHVGQFRKVGPGGEEGLPSKNDLLIEVIKKVE